MNPLTKLVFVQRILRYSCKTPLHIVTSAAVSSTWHEVIHSSEGYCIKIVDGACPRSRFGIAAAAVHAADRYCPAWLIEMILHVWIHVRRQRPGSFIRQCVSTGRNLLHAVSDFSRLIPADLEDELQVPELMSLRRMMAVKVRAEGAAAQAEEEEEQRQRQLVQQELQHRRQLVEYVIHERLKILDLIVNQLHSNTNLPKRERHVECHAKTKMPDASPLVLMCRTGAPLEFFQMFIRGTQNDVNFDVAGRRGATLKLLAENGRADVLQYLAKRFRGTRKGPEAADDYRSNGKFNGYDVISNGVLNAAVTRARWASPLTVKTVLDMRGSMWSVTLTKNTLEAVLRNKYHTSTSFEAEQAQLMRLCKEICSRRGNVPMQQRMLEGEISAVFTRVEERWSILRAQSFITVVSRLPRGFHHLVDDGALFSQFLLYGRFATFLKTCTIDEPRFAQQLCDAHLSQEVFQYGITALCRQQATDKLLLLRRVKEFDPLFAKLDKKAACYSPFAVALGQIEHVLAIQQDSSDKCCDSIRDELECWFFFATPHLFFATPSRKEVLGTVVHRVCSVVRRFGAATPAVRDLFVLLMAKVQTLLGNKDAFNSFIKMSALKSNRDANADCIHVQMAWPQCFEWDWQ